MNQAAQSQLFQVTRVRFTPGEQAVFKRRERLTPSQWAERHIVLPEGKSGRPGPWRNRVTPYLVDIMDTMAEPWLRKAVLCLSEQTGKTQSAYNFLFYAADREPGPALLVMPDEKMAGRVTQERLEPLITASPKLRGLLGTAAADMGKEKIRFRTGMTMFAGWASSASILASMPVKIVFFDESDKYPNFTGKESDPISLGTKRTRTFPHSSKIIQVSTTTLRSGYIWVALTTEAVEIRRYEARCPDCGEYQIMEFSHISWPKDVRDPRVMRTEQPAVYACAHCGSAWDDLTRDEAVRCGRWSTWAYDMEADEFKPTPPAHRPHTVAWHLPAWYSPFVSFSECAASFLEAQGDKAKMMSFVNSIECLPFDDWSQQRSEDRILKLRTDVPPGVVPAYADVLLAGVDVQENGFFYELRAFHGGRDLTSQGVRNGFVQSWEALERVLFEDEYATPDGQPVALAAGIIDSGYRTREVYEWCRGHQQMRPSKGFDRMKQPWRVSPVEKLPIGPGRHITITNLVEINTTYYKDALASKLEISPADPGAWLLHAEADQAFAAQYCSEYRDDRGKWICPPHKPNHYWDCAIYMLALADVLGLKFRSHEPKTKPKTGTQRTQTKRSNALW